MSIEIFVDSPVEMFVEISVETTPGNTVVVPVHC